MYKYKGRIVEIKKCQIQGVKLKQRIKELEQYKYDNYPGGNGTYVTGGEYHGTVLKVKIFVYDFKCRVTFDVYEHILTITGYQKITSDLLSRIESHEGDKVDVYSDDGKYFSFDPSVLLISTNNQKCGSIPNFM